MGKAWNLGEISIKNKQTNKTDHGDHLWVLSLEEDVWRNVWGVCLPLTLH